jgi:hypothetical protein
MYFIPRIPTCPATPPPPLPLITPHEHTVPNPKRVEYILIVLTPLLKMTRILPACILPAPLRVRLFAFAAFILGRWHSLVVGVSEPVEFVEKSQHI